MKIVAAFALGFSLACGFAGFVHAQTTPAPYQPGQPVSGTIRVWGQPQTKDVVQKWRTGFKKFHPDAQFDTHLTGSDVGFAALYSSKADIALMGRLPGVDSESKGFEWIYQYKPLVVEVMTGSLAKAGKSPALVVFVHKDNPLARIDLAQLDAIIGNERLRGAPQRIATWGQLGLSGEWASRPIHVYSYDSEMGTGQYFRQTVLKDSRSQNWDAVSEFKDEKGQRAGKQILDALAKDRNGLAISSLEFAGPAVKPLALVSDQGAAILPTAESVASRSYPLARAVYAVVNRKPDAPADPKVKEFLRYVLSKDGQDAIAEGGYLPLAAPIAAEQLKKID